MRAAGYSDLIPATALMPLNRNLSIGIIYVFADPRSFKSAPLTRPPRHNKNQFVLNNDRRRASYN